MTFAQPAMLAWLAAAVVPLVLHLVGQATVRSADWGAMLFLPGGAAAGSATTRGPWRARVLLAVRTAAVAGLAVAAARPQWPAAWGAMPTAGLTSAGPMTVAIVVDDSAATGYARGGPSRSDAIARAALDLIGHLSAGDRACVVPDPPPPQWADGRPSADRSAIGAQIAGLTPTGRPGDRADALDRAAALLDEVDGGRQIVVVCDRSAVAWRTVTDAWGRRWRASRDRPPPRVLVVPVGGDEADNLTVESVRPVDPPLTRGVPGTVQVTIRNAGPEPRADIPLTVWAGLRPLLVTAVSIPARGATTLDVPARFDRDGPRLVSAFIRSGDGLLADDRRDGVVDIARPARVLIVAGDIAAAQPLRAAIAPHGTAAQLGVDPAVVTVVDATRPWSTFDLDWFDAVVLADVPPLGPDRVSRLRRFVDGGRGLLVAPGGRMTAAELNESLGVDGVGLLPARLAEPVNRPPAGLRPIDGRQVIVGRFAATAAGDAARAAVRVSRAMAVVGRPAGPVVLSAADGRPVLVVADAAGGRVALSTVPLDGRWTNLPVTPFFVPLVQSTLGWLTVGRVSGRPGEHEVPLGRPIVVAVDGVIDGPATVTPPNSTRREPARVVRRGGRTEVRYDRATTPGTYRLRYRSNSRDQVAMVVVMPPAEASDLTPLTAEQWATLGRRVGFTSADATSATAAVAEGRGGGDAWAVAVAAVGLLLAAEAALARRWSTAAARGGRSRDGPG